jgi:hypothetical protein
MSAADGDGMRKWPHCAARSGGEESVDLPCSGCTVPLFRLVLNQQGEGGVDALQQWRGGILLMSCRW